MRSRQVNECSWAVDLGEGDRAGTLVDLSTTLAFRPGLSRESWSGAQNTAAIRPSLAPPENLRGTYTQDLSLSNYSSVAVLNPVMSSYVQVGRVAHVQW